MRSSDDSVVRRWSRRGARAGLSRTSKTMASTERHAEFAYDGESNGRTGWPNGKSASLGPASLADGT